MQYTIMAALVRDSETVKSVLVFPFDQTLVLSFELVDGALVGSHTDVADEDQSRLIANLRLVSDEWHSELTLN